MLTDFPWAWRAETSRSKEAASKAGLCSAQASAKTVVDDLDLEELNGSRPYVKVMANKFLDFNVPAL
jgi:hypothetical protein